MDSSLAASLLIVPSCGSLDVERQTVGNPFFYQVLRCDLRLEEVLRRTHDLRRILSCPARLGLLAR